MNRIVFKSKVGLEILVPILLVVGGLSIFYVLKGYWGAFVINVLTASFVYHIMKTTYYVIGDGILTVKCGFLVNKKIEIATIRKIAETRNPISSPALSLDRLEIFYNKFDSILVSPEDKAGFIALLKSMNNGIEVLAKG